MAQITQIELLRQFLEENLQNEKQRENKVRFQKDKGRLYSLLHANERWKQRTYYVGSKIMGFKKIKSY